MKFVLLAAATMAVAAPLSAQDATRPSTPTPTTIKAPAAAPLPDAAAPTPAAKPLGKIIFYRQSSIMGYAIACPIRYKGQEIVELGRGKFAEWNVPAGRYIVNNKTSSLEVMVDPGETRFVRCQIKPGFMSGRADLQIVDEEAWNQHKADYERKEVAFTPQ